MTQKYQVQCLQKRILINKLRPALVILGKWFSDWLMLFNVDKFKVMHSWEKLPLG